jgi:predicted nucleic acid-binding Zn ribbon protein
MRPDELEPDEHTEATQVVTQDDQCQEQQQRRQRRHHRAAVLVYSILYIYHTHHARFL